MAYPKRGVLYTFGTTLADYATGDPRVNPTLAVGDFKISKDGGAFTNLASIPTVTPSGGRRVQIVVSATEMDCDEASVQCVDQTNPPEWRDQLLILQTEPRASVVRGTVGSASTQSSIVTSALTPAIAVADQLKGRVVIFDEATTTAALRNQATDILNHTSGGVLTVSTLTTAPANGDTFVIV